MSGPRVNAANRTHKFGRPTPSKSIHEHPGITWSLTDDLGTSHSGLGAHSLSSEHTQTGPRPATDPPPQRLYAPLTRDLS